MSQGNRSVEPLMALLGQAERERDEVLAEMRRAQDAQQAARTQAEQLLVYRADYERRYREQFSTHRGVEALQTYQGFLARLAEAIAQQNRAVAFADTRVERIRVALCEQEMRVASVRKLLERRMTELRLASERRDQKQTDEFATRAAWNRLASAAALTPTA